MAPVSPAAPIPEDAITALSKGRELVGQGESDRALDSFQQAIDQAPEFVDAHRERQNLLLGRYRRGQLLREYQRFLAQAPGSAPRRYLLARLWSDPSRQLAGFEEALAVDPRCYFGHIGVGYVSLERGDLSRAESAFRQALKLEPERVEGAHGLLRALALRRDRDALEAQAELATRLLERDRGDFLAKRVLLARQLAEGDASAACRDSARFVLEFPTQDAAQLAHDTLNGYGTPADFDFASALLAGVQAPDQDGPAWLRLRALVESRAGNPQAALHALTAAQPAHGMTEEVLSLRRDLLLRSGRLEEYLTEIQQRRYGSGFDLDGKEEAHHLLGEVIRLLGSENGLDSTEAAESAVSALLESGLLDAGIQLARLSLRLHPDATGLRAHLDRATRHRRFVAELREYFVALYRQGDSLDFDDVMDDIREMSVTCLGENVVDPVVKREYFPVGVFLDPDPAHGGGLSRYFDSFGVFFMLGRRTLGVPEAYALTRIAQGYREIGQLPIYRVVGEELLIPSAAEFAGGEIAGFAFETFIVLNVDRVRDAAFQARELSKRVSGWEEDCLDEELLPASDPEELLDMREPLSLAARASLRAFREFLKDGGAPEEYPGLLLDAVESHERAHIRDAMRFLPVFSDFGEKVSLLWSLRFSPTRVEAWLEERAQAVALADARSSLSALATIAAMLPNRFASPPHSVAYHDLARAMVEEAGAHPEDYPQLDREYILLPQLDRLGDEGLKRIAKRLLAEKDRLSPE